MKQPQVVNPPYPDFTLERYFHLVRQLQPLGQPQPLRQPHLIMQPHRIRQPHHINKHHLFISIFAPLWSKVITRVPHSRVYGSGGVPPVSPTISMSV